MASNLLIVDNFLPDAEAFRQRVLSQEWVNIKFGGETYKRIQVRSSDEHKDLVEIATGRKVQQEYTITRLNYAGELPNNAIHSDNDCGEYVAILYLNKPEHCQAGTGTALWRHRETGLERFDEYDIRLSGRSPQRMLDKLARDWNCVQAWEQIELAEMQFNRAVFFPGKCFHSRWPLEAFGNSPDDGRLIWCSFFKCPSQP